MASEASPTSRNKTELLIDCTDIFKHDEKANNIVAKQVQRKVMRNKLETLDSNFYQSHDAQATPPVIKTQKSFYSSVRKRLEERARAKANELLLEKENVELLVHSKPSIPSSTKTFNDGSTKGLSSFPHPHRKRYPSQSSSKLDRTTTYSSLPTSNLTEMENTNVENEVENQVIIGNIINDDFSLKQCQFFTNWLNYIFKPMNDLQAEFYEATDTPSNLANRQKMNLHSPKLERARINANTMFHSPEFLYIRTTLAAEIARGSLSIRSDRDVFADIGLRNQMIDLLLCYSPSWLRLGLETIFQEKISIRDLLNSFNDQCQSRQSLGLLNLESQKPSVKKIFRKFIADRVLNDPIIHHKYTAGKCMIPSGKFEIEYKKELYQNVLKRILSLVIFLNHAKINSVVEGYPVLFNKDSKYKSTRDVLRILSLDYLRGEGNILKHLAGLGITSLYEQEYIDELDFSVKNLAIDLRDGVRLVKLASILCGDKENTIFSKIRVPAHSRLQKLHNVDTALCVFRELGIPKIRNIQARHIVDGHRTKVLEMFWLIMVHFKMPSLISPRNLGGNLNAKYHDGGEEFSQLLLHLTQSICQPFGCSVNDFSTCFQDGKVLCLVIYYFFPSMISLDDILPTRMDISVCNTLKTFTEVQAISNEHHNRSLVLKFIHDIDGFPMIFSNAEPSAFEDERCLIFFLVYLFSYVNLSKIDSDEMKSCDVLATKLYLPRSVSSDIPLRISSRSELNVVRLKAASVIQSTFRSWKLQRTLLSKDHSYLSTDCRSSDVPRYLRFSRVQAASIIQAMFRSWKLGQILSSKDKSYVSIKDCVRLVPQSILFRSDMYDVNLKATSAIQLELASYNIGHHETSSQTMDVVAFPYSPFSANLFDNCNEDRLLTSSKSRLTIEQAVTIIQGKLRGYNARRSIKYSLYIDVATIIQSVYRGWKARTSYVNVQIASFKIQRAWRLILHRKRRRLIAVLRISATKIQSCYRCWRLLSLFHQYKSNIVALQALVRRNQAIKQYKAQQLRVSLHNLERDTASKLIQRLYKYWKARTCAAIIQKIWRGFAARIQYSYDLSDIVFIQSLVRKRCACRVISNMRQQRYIHSCKQIQRIWRGYRSRKKLRKLIHYACTIQHWFRVQIRRASNYQTNIVRSYFAATVIQKFYRSSSSASKLNQAAIAIQTCWRGFVDRLDFYILRVSASRIQAAFRRFQFNKRTHRNLELQKLNQAANLIQTCWRSFVDRLDFGIHRVSAIRIQTAFRRFQFKQRTHRTHWNLEHLYACCVRIQSVTRCFISRKKLSSIKRSIICFQSLVRGFLVRSKSSRLYNAINAQSASCLLYCKNATQHSFENKLTLYSVPNAAATSVSLNTSAIVKTSSDCLTLGEKTKQSLEVLTMAEVFKLTDIAAALRTLEMVTRFSNECCVAFLQNKGQNALCAFMSSCNRSLPHVNLINMGLLIIINVSNKIDTTEYFGKTDFYDFLLDILHMFRDKDTIFCNASCLIHHFARTHYEYRQWLLDRSEYLKRLHGVVKLNSKRLTEKHGENTLLRQGLQALNDIFLLLDRTVKCKN